jgi:hypothetical protein
MKQCSVRVFALASAAALAAGCAVLPTPDPRDPGAVKDSPVVLRVCSVDGDGAHLAVGDQVELATNQLGRLRIRHLPSAQNQARVWNGGEAVRVRDAVLVEMLDPRGQRTNTRRFVPVGRFNVRVGDTRQHAAFDFLASKVTTRVAQHMYPECVADVGDDEVIVRGVEDSDLHGGVVHLR